MSRTTDPKPPTVLVAWPSCPWCGHQDGHRTFVNVGGTHRMGDGMYRAYSECRICGGRVTVTHEKEI